MRLDVGCGNRPTGNVNCDLYISSTAHRGNDALDLEKIPNFVRCDAKFLPFKDAAFEEVYASHVLEHFEKPSIPLKEMLRVASDRVCLVIPHRVTRKGWLHYRQDIVHKQFFDGKNLQIWLNKMGLAFMIRVRFHMFPNDIVPLFRLPWEIYVEIKKA